MDELLVRLDDETESEPDLRLLLGSKGCRYADSRSDRLPEEAGQELRLGHNEER